MLHVALWEPEIPPNTGNVARLCAAVGATLHLVGRVGFRTDDRSLRRAGLDYWDAVDIRHHATFGEFETAIGTEHIWCIETPASQRYTEIAFRSGDCIVFGSESKGLPAEVANATPPAHSAFRCQAQSPQLEPGDGRGHRRLRTAGQLHHW